jgi:hypothetical protein
VSKKKRRQSHHQQQQQSQPPQGPPGGEGDEEKTFSLTGLFPRDSPEERRLAVAEEVREKVALFALARIKDERWHAVRIHQEVVERRADDVGRGSDVTEVRFAVTVRPLAPPGEGEGFLEYLPSGDRLKAQNLLAEALYWRQGATRSPHAAAVLQSVLDDVAAVLTKNGILVRTCAT